MSISRKAVPPFEFSIHATSEKNYPGRIQNILDTLINCHYAENDASVAIFESSKD